MTTKTVLITGAAGEIGHALVAHMAQVEGTKIITVDLQELPSDIRSLAQHTIGSITDPALMASLIHDNEIDEIYHLAALLSTSAEKNPETAHKVNVGGTSMLLEQVAQLCEVRSKPVKFLFPSSIAVYGMPDLQTKTQHPQVHEGDWNYPATMYGVNKLYCELLGVYYSSNYKQLSEHRPLMVDFRSVRFPGLISAFTVPNGGTSDYGPEMLHAAAQGLPYTCFVRPDTTIPFMAMPDAVKSLLQLAAVPAEQLKRRVYNVTSFCLSAADFEDQVRAAVPDAEINYQVDEKRQRIVDTWPEDTDDTAARQDWGWQPDYGLERCFAEYLLPNITARYRQTQAT